MEGNSLIDLTKPIIVIQIEDGNHLSLATNFEDADDVLDVLEEIVENLQDMSVESFMKANNLLRRLQ